jgi:hypothetical protein
VGPQPGRWLLVSRQDLNLPPDPAEGTDFNHLYGVYCAAAQPGGAKLDPPDGRALCGATVGVHANYPGKPRCPTCREVADAFVAEWRNRDRSC